MIRSVLIDHTALQQLAEYRLLLTEITLKPATPQAKAALLRSLKHSLEVVLQRERKKQEWAALEPLTVKERPNARENQLVSGKYKESRDLPAFAGMRVHHKAVIHKLCSQFELRDHLSITLSRLQQELTKLSSKYQRQGRQHDTSSQSRTLAAIKRIHDQIAHVLAAFISMKEQVAVQYQILVDNIKLLKVKNVILKTEFPTNKQGQIKYKGKTKGITSLARMDLDEMENENRNQILVNL